MEIDGEVGNVDGFRHAFNDFIETLMDRYKQLGDQRTRAALRFLALRGTQTQEISPIATLELWRMAGDRGQFKLRCHDPLFWPEFEKFWTQYQQRWGDGGEQRSPDGTPPPTVGAIQHSEMPTPDTIGKYMTDLGYAKDDPAWWNAYLDWVMSYRARHGKTELTYDKAAEKANVSYSTFTRQIEKWEKRTNRERDSKS